MPSPSDTSPEPSPAARPSTQAATQPATPGATPPSLEDIQDALMDRLHAGEPVERTALLARYPEHREALERFLDVVDLLEAAPEVRHPAPSRLGEFRILREVGRGGMGVVYEAEQPSLRRRVALKVLPPALQNDRRLLLRFRREAEAAARLQHPNVVPVYSFGEAGGAPFFAMELVQGPSLADVLKQRRAGLDAGVPREPAAYRAWAVETVAAIGDALAYAHGRGVLHRDVKPGNVLLDAAGTPRLTDFGLALDLEATSLTVSGEVFGSPRYMSPEQAFRQALPLDARTDVYSLAVTLYELLTLRLPYDAATSSEILAALERGRLLPLRRVDPAAPAALEAVLTQALQRDPAQRYAGAAAFAADLRAAMSGGLVEAPRRARRALRWWAWRSAAAVVLLAAAALVWRAAQSERAAQLLLVDASGTADSRVPSPDEVRALATGSLPDGPAVLAAWVRARFELRSVVARQSPARVVVSLAAATDASWTPESGTDVIAVGTLELSVSGGPWFVPEGARRLELPLRSDVDGLQTIATFDLRDAVPDALAADSFELDHRITVRLLPRHATGGEQPRPPSALELSGGTVAVWDAPARTIFVYDSYPADYPERVEDSQLDEVLAASFSAPTSVMFEGTGSAGAAQRSLTLVLTFELEAARRGPPLAGMLELLLPECDGGAVLSSCALQLQPLPEGATSGVTRPRLEFDLPAELDACQERAVLHITHGTRETVRLRFRADREVALGDPTLDRYWGGSFEADVPLRPRGF